MKIIGLILLHASISSHFALGAVHSPISEQVSSTLIKSPSNRQRYIYVQSTSTDDESKDVVTKKHYPLNGLEIKIRLSYDTGLESKLQEQGKDLWGTLEKITAEAQKSFLHTNGRPYLRLIMTKGDSFTLSNLAYDTLGVRNLNSFAELPKPEGIDAAIYIAKKPTSVDELARVYDKKICRDKKKAVALVLHDSLDTEAQTGKSLAVSIASLLGICNDDFTWTRDVLLTRYEEGRLPCLTGECIDNYLCSSKSSCSDGVTALLCPKKCNQCLILYPPSGLQLRLRLNYNQAFETSWSSKGSLTAMHNILAYSETYFMDADSKPYLRFEIINGTKFTDPKSGGLKVTDLDALAKMMRDTEGSDADIFFGTSYSTTLQHYYGEAKSNAICRNRKMSVGMVLQGSWSQEPGTAETFGQIVATLLGLRTTAKPNWTMKEFKDAYERGEHKCLKPYICHDQFVCYTRGASMCSDGYTNHLCPKMCGFCRNV